ncbi:unnamed protein product [Acanthoscelides obtectus]|uniref:Malate dehydrogenase, mitochondrial n=1 Tax=Acanthoscelides obtectus TaxID=200917 RepID=A0A9P0PVG1_ACAOB|nr:unnamed protein product [Acanthoscelides obtectus]CAK1622019.1 Probable malate dehydrogenase, mitochondrial [Acanthoscelides obtectus]
MWIKMIFNITPVFQKHLNEYVSNFFENGLLDKIIGCKRNYSLSSGNVKVTVVGAAGKMGKPLCLMLKQSLMIDELSMHDVKTTGDALELNNIDTSCKVTAYSGKSNLPPALKEEIEKITASIKKPQQKKETSGFLAAFATARFILSLVKGIRGHKNVIECAYVPSKVHPELKYLSTPVQLGIHGVSKNLGLQELTDYEQCMFDNVVTCLAADITKGEKYIGTHAECSRHAKQQ